MKPVASVRMDKWLWAVRLYKTRTQAAEACTGGKVKVNGQNVKPARAVHIGEVVTAVTGPLTRTVRVLGLIDRRVGAKIVPQFAEDLTPPEEYAKPREKRFDTLGFRRKGAGRPTKKERRLLQSFFGEPPPF